jgi:asparagine synthase (glutamine-hydrolysing)
MLSAFNTLRYPALVRRVRAAGLTYLNPSALNDLYEAVTAVEQAGTPGCLIEAGCALGGSAIVMASAKAQARPFFIYDVFGMIPPPTADDGADVHARYATITSGKAEGLKGGTYYGYQEDLYDQVGRTFEEFGFPPARHHIRLVKGLFEETLRPEGPVALAHIDGDWYQSVMTCLERIVPHLVAGATLVVDDYYDWSGCRKAVDDFFAGKREQFRFTRKARLHITRL